MILFLMALINGLDISKDTLNKFSSRWVQDGSRFGSR
jgi:hypothetical protein